MKAETCNTKHKQKTKTSNDLPEIISRF